MPQMKKIFQNLRERALYLLLFSASGVIAQTRGIEAGATALQSLTSDMQAYIDPVTTVVYVVAAVVGLVGALRVSTGWLGACLFLLIANTVLRAMFVA